jgi:Family of unknown function (DUF5990)
MLTAEGEQFARDVLDIFLSLGTVDDDGFTMFRRAKLMLDAVEPPPSTPPGDTAAS